MHGQQNIKTPLLSFSLVAKCPSRHTYSISHFLDRSDISQSLSCSVLSALYTENAAMRNYTSLYRPESTDSHIFQVGVTFRAKVRYNLTRSRSECQYTMWRHVCTSGHLHYSSPLVTNAEMKHHNVDVRYQTVRILYIYIYIYTQSVTGGTDQTSGGCSLC